MAEQDKRQLKIKTGSVTRLKKELSLYAKEREKERQRVDSLKRAQADEHDIKHAEDVLAEASLMVPDTRQRLEAALQDLSKLLDEVKDVQGVSGCEELLTANKTVSEGQQLLASSENFGLPDQ